MASDRLSFDLSEDGQTMIIRETRRKRDINHSPLPGLYDNHSLQLTAEELFTLQTIITGQWKHDHFL